MKAGSTRRRDTCRHGHLQSCANTGTGKIVLEHIDRTISGRPGPCAREWMTVPSWTAEVHHACTVTPTYTYKAPYRHTHIHTQGTGCVTMDQGIVPNCFWGPKQSRWHARSGQAIHDHMSMNPGPSLIPHKGTGRVSTHGCAGSVRRGCKKRPQHASPRL